MDFLKVMGRLVGEMEAADLRFALIGGFALGLRGVARATADLDFILALEDLEAAEVILVRAGYQREYGDANVSHFRSPDSAWGRIDIIHAFRAHALGMLERADRLEVGPELALPVVEREDLIGLKIQALTNDPDREEQDWMDIRLLLEAAAREGQSVDWERIGDYLALFEKANKLSSLKGWYERIESQ